MLKRSPSRGSRSRGIKVKHILQIALLVGVCCWLIYQVKRSHDKKKEFDQTDNEITTKTQGGVDVLKLGRKDLQRRDEEVHPGEKQEEDDEDETGGEEENLKHEEEEGREELKHEAVNEDEGSKHEEETEDDVREGGDDDIDENDQEKADNESDRGGKNVDDEKLKEVSDEEAGGNERDKEYQRENENSSDDQENDGSDPNTHGHEAREENYKGDDASSAVAHDDHSTTSETEKVNIENSNENSELNSKEQDGESSDTKEFNQIHNSSRLTEVDKMADDGTSTLEKVNIENSNENSELNSKEQDGESSDTKEFNRIHNSSRLTEVDKMADNGTSTLENTSDVKLNENTSLPTDGSVGNPILTTQSDDHPESSNSTSSTTTETNKVENVDSSQQNGTDSQLTMEVDKMADNETSTIENPSDVKLNGNTSLPTDGSVENSILTTQSNDQSEPSNSTSSTITETNNVENVDSSQQNGTELGSNHHEEKIIDNITAQNETSPRSLILTNLNDTVLANNISESQPNPNSKDENPNGVEGETINISNKAELTVTGDKTTEPEKDDKTTEPENVLPTTIIKENSESTQNEKLEENGKSGGDSSESANHTEDPVREDPIDSNDAHVTERVDLDTLPDVRSEVDHSREAAAAE